MSHDRPTPAERAANAAHDPLTCPTCRNADLHGDQAPTADEHEIDRLNAEVARLTKLTGALHCRLVEAADRHRAEGMAWSAAKARGHEERMGLHQQLKAARSEAESFKRIAAAVRARGGR